MRSIVETKLHFSPEVLQIAAIAKAMSHPVRLYILQKLSGMESSCLSGDLVGGIPIGRSAFSRHL